MSPARKVRNQLAVLAAIAFFPQLSLLAQSSLPSPSVQLAVSNIISRLTNDEAKAAFRAKMAAEFPEQVLLPLNEFTGWSTNGPAVYAGKRSGVTNLNNNPIFLELHRLGYPAPPLSRVSYFTNIVFDHFLAQSLNNLAWTNFIAHTNGRTTQIWSVKNYPPGWPANPPVIRWNPNSIMWGMGGLTALSPSWEAEGGPGQAPITALTRRHGYTRGHGIASDGFGTLFLGKKVWFLTLDNKLIETKVIRTVVRRQPVSGNDYTILLFSNDLPDSIEPIRVVADKTRNAKYPLCLWAPALLFLTEQYGNVSAEAPGFTVPVMKPMDSGSPNMLPLPGELVFYSGRTTSGPSAAMQADMDELCRSSGLDPAKYQMQWVDLSGYPSYSSSNPSVQPAPH
jgi:hypothetical protein